VDKLEIGLNKSAFLYPAFVNKLGGLGLNKIRGGKSYVFVQFFTNKITRLCGLTFLLKSFCVCFFLWVVVFFMADMFFYYSHTSVG